MGKFDKKVNKFEPDAPNSQKILKKRSNPELNSLQNKHGKGSDERDRNLKILGQLQKEKDYKEGGKVNANMDSKKMIKKQQKKEDKFKKSNK